MTPPRRVDNARRARRTGRSGTTLLGAFVLVAAVIAGCGGDDGDADTTDAAPPTAPDGSGSGTAPSDTGGSPDEPTVGGEATVLQWSESASLDPVKAIGSSGTDGMRMFSVYGALVTANPETGEVERVMAESFEPDEALTTWTLTVRAGITFSDGTPYDAAAVQSNWERIQDPASGSPALGVAAQIESMSVLDDLTLEVHLSAPNGQFDRTVSRNALNYIASPQAIEAGTDLSATPIGAGPFLLDEWRRDDRMILERNPDYFDAPRPYLDRLTIRVVNEDSQRVDTYATGEADAFYVTIDDQVEQALSSRDGAFHGPEVGTATVVIFNDEQPPFDDVRVRQIFASGIDRQALADSSAPGGSGATSMTPEDSPWYTPDAGLPEYDPEMAQRLLDEVNADGDGSLEVTILGTTNPQNIAIVEFMQTALGQLDGIEVELEQLDSPTFIGRVLQGDFGVTTWGLPWTDPEPLLYANLHSDLPSNLMNYADPTVDAALDDARASTDDATRKDAYDRMFAQLATDLPFYPNGHANYGYVVSADLGGAQYYEDGTLRPDLLWRAD